MGAGAVLAGAGGVLSACGSGIKGANSGSTKGITIGWIHPLTGPLAGFGAADNWVVSKIKQTTPYKNGFKIGGKTYPVTIKSYDSQSSVSRAGDLARSAILSARGHAVSRRPRRRRSTRSPARPRPSAPH